MERGAYADTSDATLDIASMKPLRVWLVIEGEGSLGYR